MTIQPRRSLQVAETPRIGRVPSSIGSEASERRVVHRLIDVVRDTFRHHAVLAGFEQHALKGERERRRRPQLYPRGPDRRARAARRRTRRRRNRGQAR